MGAVASLPIDPDIEWRFFVQETRKAHLHHPDSEGVLEEMLPLLRAHWLELWPAKNESIVTFRPPAAGLSDDAQAAVDAYTDEARVLVDRLVKSRVNAFIYMAGYLFQAIYFRRQSGN